MPDAIASVWAGNAWMLRLIARVFGFIASVGATNASVGILCAEWTSNCIDSSANCVDVRLNCVSFLIELHTINSTIKKADTTLSTSLSTTYLLHNHDRTFHSLRHFMADASEHHCLKVI